MAVCDTDNITKCPCNNLNYGPDFLIKKSYERNYINKNVRSDLFLKVRIPIA